MHDAILPTIAIPTVAIALGWKQQKDKEKDQKKYEQIQ